MRLFSRGKDPQKKKNTEKIKELRKLIKEKKYQQALIDTISIFIISLHKVMNSKNHISTIRQ